MWLQLWKVDQPQKFHQPPLLRDRLFDAQLDEMVKMSPDERKILFPFQAPSAKNRLFQKKPVHALQENKRPFRGTARGRGGAALFQNPNHILTPNKPISLYYFRGAGEEWPKEFYPDVARGGFAQ